MERRKTAFWAFALLAIAMISLPSSYFVRALNRYERFVSGFEPAPLRPVRVAGVPHRGGKEVGDGARLEFVEFRLRAPSAKGVEVIGDFNGWKEGTLALQRQPDGTWELLLPLPAGRYRYAFVVDGERQLDPRAVGSEEADGKLVSVRTIP